MNVKKVKEQGLTQEFEVTISANDFGKQIQERLQDAAKKYKKDGFRPGKVPASYIKKMHGPAIVGEAAEETVSDSVNKIMTDKKIRPAIRPKIDIKEVEEGKDLKYHVTFEIYPEVPEIQYADLSLTRYIPEISDKEIDDAMDRLLKANRNWETINEDRTAKKGDAVKINFEGKLDGKPFLGGSGKDMQLELGGGQFVPGFEEQLEGVKKGEKKTLQITFPEEYGAKDLAGKETTFDVEVLEILSGNEPKADESFAKKMGLENIEKLREAIKQRFEQDYSGIGRTHMKKELFDVLDQKYKFEVPESLVKIELDALMQREQHEHEQDHDHENCDNPDHKHHEEKKGKKETKQDKKKEEEYHVLAERRVRLGIILAELGKRNNVQVEEGELRTAVFNEARNFPGHEQKVVEFYRKNPEAIDRLKGPILEEKVVNYVFGQSKVEEKKLPVKELMKLFEEQG